MSSFRTTRKRATKHQLQSLAGKLNYISNCVRPARRFMARILDTLRAAANANTVTVTEELRKDIAWFEAYARNCNGRVLIEPKLPLLVIECDACLAGAGGHTDAAFYDLTFPQQLTDSHHISQLEALNVVVAVKILVPQGTRGHRVLVKTDNMATMFALSSGRTRDPVLAACAREIWFAAATFLTS